MTGRDNMADAGFTTAGHAQNSPSTTATSAGNSHLHHQQHHDDSRPPNDDTRTPQSHSSSQPPAFRLADIKTAPPAPAPAPAPTNRVPPSPVSPVLAPDGSPSYSDSPDDRQSRARASHRSHDQSAEGSASLSADSPPRPTSRSRASTYQQISAVSHPDLLAGQARRPVSYPESPANDLAHPHQSSAGSVARAQGRRAHVQRSNTDPHRTPAPETSAQPLSDRDAPAIDGSQGQRELFLPKLSQLSPSDEKRGSTSHRPPPVSYKPPANPSAGQPAPATTPIRVPPIRGFRSSSSRKSLVLDMSANSRPFDLGDDYHDGSPDHTLRALEGRHGQGALPMTPPASAGHEGPIMDDTGDVFMKIAREEPVRRIADGSAPEEPQTSASRTIRSSHRRPLSTTVAAYHPASPPRLSRRLSDQQDNARPRGYEDDRASEVSRITTYRTQPRERQAPPRAGEDWSRARTNGTVLRPSPLTPRSTTLPTSGSENFVYGRRRPSVTESNSTPTNRTPTYRASGSGHGHTKSYNSSPLVRAYDAQNHQAPDNQHGVEGTESTASTTAPSTVWDELDDLKSRLHRLELTGKLPSTSGAAVSRVSDERPPTATTTVTTVSSSPKRVTGGVATQVADTSSVTPSQREAHHLLHSALTKSKPFLTPEVYRALECVSSDAIGLSSMMGLPGQPGPVSSGASTVGSGATVTDRQLRRKADSVCRGLTELCVALGEEAAQARPPVPAQSYTAPQNDVPSTPIMSKQPGGFSGQRRASVYSEQGPPPSNVTSPRAVSKFEERRNTLLSGSALPSPRVMNSSNPATPHELTASRRSSLLVSRTRRAESEDPEDGRRSSLLRTRRAGTEEPDEGRRTSVLVRNRRGTVGEDEDEARFRAPSRATTEVHAARGAAREYHSQMQNPADETTAQPASSLPRRRFISSNLGSSRLAAPAGYIGTPPRKYLDKATSERDNGAPLDQPGEERLQRHLSLGPSMTIHRSGSLSARRQNRDSTITNASTAATTGGYR